MQQLVKALVHTPVVSNDPCTVLLLCKLLLLGLCFSSGDQLIRLGDIPATESKQGGQC